MAYLDEELEVEVDCGRTAVVVYLEHGKDLVSGGVHTLVIVNNHGQVKAASVGFEEKGWII
jgi:hypothetical protein